MLPPVPMGGANRGVPAKLAKLYKQLSAEQREDLIQYAEFLLQKAAVKPEKIEIHQPESIGRPAQESVVAAIQRLTKSYFMLEKENLLHETSDLMSAHIIHGRKAEEVINDLEELFEKHYQKYQASLGQD